MLHAMLVDDNVLLPHRAKFEPLPMSFLPAAKNSRLFSLIKNLDSFEHDAINYHSHKYAVNLEEYERVPIFNEFFTPLATAVD